MHLFRFVYPAVTLTYKSYLHAWRGRLLFRNVVETPSTPIKAEYNQSAFYQQRQTLLRLRFEAQSADSFSRAHFMVGKPLQTTDSIHVCCHLITAFVVWSLKAVKWENPTAQACNQSLTAREWVEQIPDAPFFQLRRHGTRFKCLNVWTQHLRGDCVNVAGWTGQQDHTA